MKLPSIQQIVNATRQGLLRFPVLIFFALLGSAISIMLVHSHMDDRDADRWGRVILCCVLAVPLFFALHVFSERRQLPFLRKAVLFLGGLGIIAAFYSSIFSAPDLNAKHIYRFSLLLAGFHLVSAFSAFYRRIDLPAFWRFNELLFIRFLVSSLYAGVLYLGLVIALLAVDNLFHVNIDDDYYLSLFIVMAGIFHPVFFLSGLPHRFESCEEPHTYPKGLKIFTQFVLLPLVAVYLVILYAYAGKIMVEWELPKGWVSYLVLSFSIVGIFSLLLIYPVRNDEENKWIRTFSRLYYIVIIPLTVLLFVSILTRISAYGLTEDRYIVLVTGLWIAAISLYFIFSRVKNIILIPVSLAVIALLSAVGPWNMFNLSRISQASRLEQLLEKNQLLENGKIRTLTDTENDSLPGEDLEQIGSVTDYLMEHHGQEALRPYFPDSCFSEDEDFEYRYRLLDCVNLHYRYSYRSDKTVYLNCDSNSIDQGLDVSEFAFICSFGVYDNAYRQYDSLHKFVFLLEENNQLKIVTGPGKTVAVHPLNAFASEKFERYKDDRDVQASPEEMSIAVGENILLLLSNFSVSKEEDGRYVIQNMNGHALFRDLP